MGEGSKRNKALKNLQINYKKTSLKELQNTRPKNQTNICKIKSLI